MWVGHYVGAITIADTVYFGDGVVTADGALRLYVGGPYDDGGELQTARPSSSEQLVGKIQVQEDQWSGTGIIIGQECGVHAANRFCAQTAAAQLSGTLSFGAGTSGTENMHGKIQVTASGGTETWTLDLLLWPDVGQDTGQFREVLAEFAFSDDVIVTFDASGTFFFQSAGSGCVGNGTLGMPADGSSVYSATLLLENCNGPYTYLNGTYEGLAVGSPSSRWDYDSLPRIWLSKPRGDTSPAALTMLGEPL
jgi:hypothetical protein